MIGAVALGAALAAAPLALTAHARDALEFDQGVDARSVLDSLAAASAPDPVAAAPLQTSEGYADWLILYYINAKNDLEPYAGPNIQQMEAVGSTARVHIVAEVGLLSSGVKRYRFVRDGDPSRIGSPLLEDLGRADMGDWRHLAEFGRWAKARYPAKKTMLVVWSHGDGWLKSPAAANGPTKGISYDDESGRHISTPELARALAAMGGVDIYASEACLMQMAEVAFEVSPYARVIIGSEENEPAVAWDYSRVLGPLVEHPEAAPQQLASLIVRSYSEHYAGIGEETTYSALDPSALREFAGLLDAWTAAVMTAGETRLVKGARARVQSFDDKDNVDLLNLVELIGAGSDDTAVRSTGADLARFIGRRLVFANATSGRSHGGARGLAVYLPRGSVNPDYAELAWARTTRWPQFAAWVASLR